ncbi:putative transposase [Rhizobium sp. BK275]|uniref:DDE-type integrase/transposase/recombinase n=1 Tax=Rhizobium sp. BK275 TaxID=2587077 RepID=UPI00161AD6D0|nr:DDE-type integrase/transposase/recombinase [Rhizobium sp. BK275]MBB3389728.1 putative transposase [Rhizobium sp. BK275]
MSFHRHNDFLLRENTQVAIDIKQLEIPPDPENGESVQAYGFAAGARFDIFNRDLTKRGPFVVISYNNYDGLGGLFQVQNIASQQMAHLSHWQISQLERQGRFIPQEYERAGKTIESVSTLDADAEAVAKRKLGYVMAALKLQGKGTVMPPRAIIRRAIALHAEKLGEKPYSYGTIRPAIRAYLDAPFNRLLALAPGKTRGNCVKAFSQRLEEVLRQAVEHAWRMPKGTAITATRRFDRLLFLPENSDVREEACDSENNIVAPSQATIERRFYGVDHFTRMLLRHGPEAAMRIHDIRIPQAVPKAALDVVEVDYTTLDCNVFDDKYAFIYGRPSVILFRDRMSAAITGHAIFFGKPSFEAFVHGLKQAIYPKDMSAYPGLSSPFYGKPSVIVVDADPHLVGEDMHNLCDELGIILQELRPGEPNSKGGLERTIRTLNDSLIHNLPGTTHSNPTRKKEFDDEKELGLPQITLGELERHMTAWVCEYNYSSHRGLGFLRTFKGVPAERWFETIGQAGQRRPIDPQVFARASGHVHHAAIENGCIVWDHIVYSDPKLVVLATSPTSTAPSKAKARKSRKPTTLYRCTRDPSDLGGIWVDVPETGTAIYVPAAETYKSYASGLRLFQHRKAVGHHNKHSRRPLSNVKDLETALAAHGQDLKDLYEQRKTQKTADKLAAFFRGVATKVRRSRIVEAVTSTSESAKRIDYANPTTPRGVRRKSQAARDYDVRDTPAAVHVRNEEGRLEPGDPLINMKPHHTKPEKPTVRAGKPVETGALAGYEDPDDIEEIIKRRRAERRKK